MDLRGPAPAGQVLDEIGSPPYDLGFEIDLDGTTHVASPTWPDDLNTETWYIDLDLVPALPRAE